MLLTAAIVSILWEPAATGSFPLGYSEDPSDSRLVYNGSGTEHTIVAPLSLAGTYTITLDDLASGPMNISELDEDANPEEGDTNCYPKISQTVGVENSLTASPGLWCSDASRTFSGFTYQWTRDDVDISGATSNTYNYSEEDPGVEIGVEVTGTDSSGSNATAAINPYTTANPSSFTNNGDGTFDLQLSLAGGLTFTDNGDGTFDLVAA